ncbi:hypothetical protein [Paenibacillus arenilitoris]|uniref:Uncharacterized protein n=1 Tax=Paenibacillus arenilitoris TaxID=2772299 RepID=A0A927CRU3_9BACL|nr:hypothetical protein [Paenibacillus arenilitoris]MBD2872983.1 hypothetical protein [Paenibacillus arenilitoris]
MLFERLIKAGCDSFRQLKRMGDFSQQFVKVTYCPDKRKRLTLRTNR